MFIIVYIKKYFAGSSKIDFYEIDVCECNDYEKTDYNLASRKEFNDKQEAINYAVQLAVINDKKYVGVKKAGDSSNLKNVLD